MEFYTCIAKYAFFGIRDEKLLASARKSWYHTMVCSGIEAVITGLTRNQFEGNLTWVRIPLAAPNKNVFHPRMEHVFFVSQASAQNATCLNSATQHRMMAKGT